MKILQLLYRAERFPFQVFFNSLDFRCFLTVLKRSASRLQWCSCPTNVGVRKSDSLERKVRLWRGKSDSAAMKVRLCLEAVCLPSSVVLMSYKRQGDAFSLMFLLKYGYLGYLFWDHLGYLCYLLFALFGLLMLCVIWVL